MGEQEFSLGEWEIRQIEVKEIGWGDDARDVGVTVTLQRPLVAAPSGTPIRDHNDFLVDANLGIDLPWMLAADFTVGQRLELKFTIPD